jgi:hypothetical protein
MSTNGHPDPKAKARRFAYLFGRALDDFETVPEAMQATELAMSLPAKPIPDCTAALAVLDDAIMDISDEVLLLLPAGSNGIALGPEIEDAVTAYRRRLLQGLGPWSSPPTYDAPDVGVGAGTSSAEGGAADLRTSKPSATKRQARAKLKARLGRARERLKKHKIRPARSSESIIQEAFPTLA